MDSGSSESAWSEAGGGVLDDVGIALRSGLCGLTTSEQQAGHTFVTLWPSAYFVAHVDYVRSVRIEPLGPERTRLVAEWHFATETLDQSGFKADEVAEFGKIITWQDGQAVELNQRGMQSPYFTAARLMPEEYEIHRLHAWLLAQMEGTARPTKP